MAWGSQGAVFLGEDLMHTRDYSDETARVIDEEVERILREQEERATEQLKRYRKGLDKVAAALLEKETIDGAEVGRLVDEGFGRPVHADRRGPPVRRGPPTAAPTPGGHPCPRRRDHARDETAEMPRPDDTIGVSQGAPGRARD